MNSYLLRRNPTTTFDLLDDAFNSFFSPTFFEKKTDFMKTDIKETEKSYLLEIEMAGYDKKDLSISLEKGYLTISAERKESLEENQTYLRRERSSKISRTYYVGDVNKETIKAKYENGVLEIDIPKKEKEIPTAHTITID
ncbi:MAG: Hsp20/alpha crystallin family protein [Clostridia bacterium]|nr:Hsp20/alpha crystallin family protein [Clostridia bacterium]